HRHPISASTQESRPQASTVSTPCTDRHFYLCGRICRAAIRSRPDKSAANFESSVTFRGSRSPVAPGFGRGSQTENRGTAQAESLQRGGLQLAWNRLQQRERLRQRAADISACADARSQFHPDSQQSRERICRSGKIPFGGERVWQGAAP